MLYLPPHWAHNGIAIGECTTYSIGFRSPTYQELAQQFLGYLQDTIQLDGIYTDPDLRRQAHSAEIGDAMVDRVAESLRRITWSRDDVRASSAPTSPSPRPTSSSTRRTNPSSTTTSRCLRRRDLPRPRSLLLFTEGQFFLNGEPVHVETCDQAILQGFADRRRLDSIAGLSEEGTALLYDWYCCGFAHVSDDLMD
jgi:50S ribosomal protein L16 3-hydroxylase